MEDYEVVENMNLYEFVNHMRHNRIPYINACTRKPIYLGINGQTVGQVPHVLVNGKFKQVITEYPTKKLENKYLLGVEGENEGHKQVFLPGNSYVRLEDSGEDYISIYYNHDKITIEYKLNDDRVGDWFRLCV